MANSRMEQMKNRHRRCSRIQWGISVGAVLVFMMLLLFVFFSPITVENNSMQPTLEQGDIVFYSRIKKALELPKTAQMIVYRDAQGARQLGRIIALSNSTVEIKNGEVFINGKYRLDEHEYTTAPTADMPPVLLEDNQLFVLPDNRSDEEILMTQGVVINMDDIMGHISFNLNEFCFYG